MLRSMLICRISPFLQIINLMSGGRRTSHSALLRRPRHGRIQADTFRIRMSLCEFSFVANDASTYHEYRCKLYRVEEQIRVLITKHYFG
jgi:hypothetical protein